MGDIYNFEAALVNFNRMYGLPVNDTPTVLGSKRLKDLKDILQKELNEIDEIIQKMELVESMEKLSSGQGEKVHWNNEAEMKMEVLVGVADLMGDFQVYCGSEMKKWGIPQNATLRIIMESNKSKLGADGLPIVNEAGKVGKGPNYWKPEPMLTEMFARYTAQGWFDYDELARHLIEAKQASAADKQG